MIADRAEVFKAGRHAATLSRTSEGVRFEYREDYLAELDAKPIASTLPLTDQPRHTQAGAVPPYFAGLLPEGRRLTSLRQNVKTSADDELSLLVAIGADPIGDVQVLAADAVESGEQPTEVEPVVTVAKDFRDVRFADLLDDAGIIDPIGIAGVQEKVSGRVLSLPVRRAHERFILKLNPPEYPHLVENEAYFLTLAKRSGLRVAEAKIVRDADDRPGLLVTRFDRAPGPDGPLRLAVEDACQAQDLWPADKYNTTSEKSTQALARLCAAQTVGAREIYCQLVFAWLTGNGDVHTKNISVLTGETGETRIAPAYDLPSTVPYRDTTLALSLSGKVSGLSRRSFLSFARHIGVREEAADDVLDRLLEATADLDAELSEGALPFDADTMKKTRRQLAFRRQQLT